MNLKKEIINKVLYLVLSMSMFVILIISILKTDKMTFISSDINTNLHFENEITSDVGSFNTDSTPLENTITQFLNECFSTRNNGFLNGNVENLYNYYDLNNNNSKYCLKYEFKRIGYMRDWAIQRTIMPILVDSSVTIKDMKDLGNRITLKATEDFTFSYMYSDNTTVNKFNVKLIHIISLVKSDNTYKIDKDYYLDFLGDDIKNYNYNLSQTTIPHTKTINPDFKINTTYEPGDILSYFKLSFIDHRGVVTGYDSKGYPLINSTTTNSTNLPYDLGWKDKNIKID